jgi:predicted  nucleic acid-binding Zn-ribbon protein
MFETVSSLFRLQELEIVQEEARLLHQDAEQKAIDSLAEQAERIRKALPEAELRRFDALRRHGVAVAREVNGLCSACRLRVPVGDLNRMRRKVIPWICPNCGVFLLLS